MSRINFLWRKTTAAATPKHCANWCLLRPKKDKKNSGKLKRFDFFPNETVQFSASRGHFVSNVSFSLSEQTSQQNRSRTVKIQTQGLAFGQKEMLRSTPNEWGFYRFGFPKIQKKKSKSFLVRPETMFSPLNFFGTAGEPKYLYSPSRPLPFKGCQVLVVPVIE